MNCDMGMLMHPTDVFAPCNTQLHGNGPFWPALCPAGLFNKGDDALPASTAKQWKLVWCQWFQCHAQEKVLRRHFAHHLVGPLGGKLLRLTCEKTMARLQGNMAGPFVLVTDWRCAKPIMEHVQDRPGCTPPNLTIVLCTLRRQLVRAWKWIQTLPPAAGPFYACVDDQIPWLNLGGMVLQCCSLSIGHMFPPLEFEADQAKNEDASSNRSTEVCSIDSLQTEPVASIEQEPRVEEADEDSDKCMAPIKEWKQVPLLPAGVPAPVTLIRGPGGVLTMRCN